MRGGRRHSGGQDAAHLRARLQQAAVSVSAADHARTYGLGHRPVPHLQGREYLHHLVTSDSVHLSDFELFDGVTYSLRT